MMLAVFIFWVRSMFELEILSIYGDHSTVNLKFNSLLRTN